MPIYEYACNHCQHDFERLVIGRDSDRTACPQCGESDVRRRLSTFSFSGGAAEPMFDGGCGRCGAETPGQCQQQN